MLSFVPPGNLAIFVLEDDWKGQTRKEREKSIRIAHVAVKQKLKSKRICSANVSKCNNCGLRFTRELVNFARFKIEVQGSHGL